jgi:putative transposase
MMRLMNQQITEDPTAEVLTIQTMLEENRYKAGSERVLRLMRFGDIIPIYPRKQLTVLDEKKYIHPYLFKKLQIERPNQIWEIDITCVTMKDDFLYLTAAIDVFS